MLFWDATLPSAADNLAADEALLDACEAGGPEVLRFWQPDSHFVVLGYSNEAAREANLDACRRDHVPVLRRCSGGGAVLQGPGCLNYTLVLRIDNNPALESIPGANRHIMERQLQALRPLESKLSAAGGIALSVQGITDLCLDGRKFSGNSQRRLRHALLFHGVFLLDFDLALMETYLATPSRQPAYRQGRSHKDFVTNLPISAHNLKSLLRKVWPAEEPLANEPPWQNLVRDKYSTSQWNLAR